MMEPEWIPENAILTPHRKEFDSLYIKYQKVNSKNTNQKLNIDEQIKSLAGIFHCTILLKGEIDHIVFEKEYIKVKGGNAGMTKGGTGDVLAGLVAALYCKNDAFTSAVTASSINKKAGEDLYQKMGLWFNASDLADQISQTMKRLLLG